MAIHQETGNHGFKIPHISPEVAGAAAVGLVLATGTGAAIDRYVLPHPSTHTIDISNVSTLDSGRSIIPEVKAGQNIDPIKGSIVQTDSSTFQSRIFKVIQTDAELQEALKKITDQTTQLGLDYSFDPKTEVVVLAALGNDNYLVNDKIDGFKATAQPDGRIEVQIQRTETFINHYSRDLFPSRNESPVMLVRFPRVAENGKEASWTLGLNDDVRYEPGYRLGQNGELQPLKFLAYQ
ncbi:MAG TPA: hypothetical protein VHE53_02550 [Patescibacteria group bacterium]|nr:hypothetical protein [Patescibacteria group bacterium]